MSKEKEHRFQMILEEKHAANRTQILKDRETGVLYLFYTWGGMCGRIDAASGSRR